MEAFEGRGFLSTAIFLATRTDDEGSLRSAISRAYYACFHRARDYARERSAVVRQDGSAHAAVRRFLKMSDSKLAWDLQRLHVLRKYADYDVPFPGGQLEIDVGIALGIATRILARIDTLSIESGPPSQGA